MRIIFTDIDGVLNSEDTFLNATVSSSIPIEEEYLELLEYIVTATGAQIVITSTWRLAYDNDDFQQFLKILGQRQIKVLDYTPALNLNRETEIKEWLNSHKDVTSFVILDDEEECYGELKNYLIQTNWSGIEQGLTLQKALMAINLLIKDKQEEQL